jgi:hypothetical protein
MFSSAVTATGTMIEPYGVYRLITKDNEIYINEARCVPIKTLCPDDVKERSC